MKQQTSCEKCGAFLPEKSRFCPQCGVALADSCVIDAQNAYSSDRFDGEIGAQDETNSYAGTTLKTAFASADASACCSGSGHFGFWSAIKACFRNFINDKGRASQREFWYWIAFNFMILIPLTVPYAIVIAWFWNSVAAEVAPEVEMFLSLAFDAAYVAFFWGALSLCPSVSVTVRRLHDANLSGGWSLLMFLLAGSPLTFMTGLAIIGILRPTEGENKYGLQPESR